MNLRCASRSKVFFTLLHQSILTCMPNSISEVLVIWILGTFFNGCRRIYFPAASVHF